ncbi:MAG: hypothetical protein GKS00_24725 [Alphaproteobacteria bacterium]|nr:hypothetical protein [Alphaproteobacteria bacterium]
MEGKNVRAIEELHRLLKIYQPEIDLENVGYLVAPAEMTPEEWAEEQERKNLTRKPPPGIEDKLDE